MLINYEYMRDKKGESLKKLHNEGVDYRENIGVKSYKNAMILPSNKISNLLFGLGGVIDASGEYVSNSGIDDRFGGFYEVDNYLARNDKVVYCGYLVNHWGHFLIESISRLWYVLKNDTSIDKFIFVCELGKDFNLSGNYKEFFELLGIEDKIEIINTPCIFSEVVVPDLSYKRSQYYSDEYKSIFRTVRSNALKKDISISKSDKIFLSRSRFAKNSEVGLEMLDNYFIRNNYKVLYPEMVSLAELIHYIEKSDICAAESGTLPHNFLFSEDGKKVEIVERQATINEVQVEIDVIKQLNVTYIDAFFTIYPVGAGYGPYFLAYNDLFHHFTIDNSYVKPDNKYISQSYYKMCFRDFIKIYRKNYGMNLGFEKWQLSYINEFWESYEDGQNYIGDFMNYTKPFKISQNFKFHFVKQNLKRLLYLFKS